MNRRNSNNNSMKNRRLNSELISENKIGVNLMLPPSSPRTLLLIKNMMINLTQWIIIKLKVMNLKRDSIMNKNKWNLVLHQNSQILTFQITIRIFLNKNHKNTNRLKIHKYLFPRLQPLKPKLRKQRKVLNKANTIQSYLRMILRKPRRS